MRPILIDALHITTGGGRVLLEYLCENLIKQDIPFILIRDIRCASIRGVDPSVEFVLSSDQDRKKFYTKNELKFHSILCFANIPPLKKQQVPVYTYFHNINLLDIPSEYGLFRTLKTLLKRIYISFYSKNTDAWIVQTPTMEKNLRKKLPCRGKHVFRFPFYREINQTLSQVKVPRTDYILVGDYTGTRGHDELLLAWETLSKNGFKPTLHLTVSYDNPFSTIIDEYNKKGVNVVNHGIISHDEVVKLYHMCIATIYPSKNESLGLGIIEAVEAGCDVIGVNRSYLLDVCTPSTLFEDVTAEYIAHAVSTYASTKTSNTTLNVFNNIDYLIDCLIK